MSLTESTPEAAARAASLSARSLAILPVSARNEALQVIHDAMLSQQQVILEANKKDMELAHAASQSGTLSQSVLKRLDLSRPGKFEDMLQGILDVKRLEDPIGKVDMRTKLDEGLELERVSCPIGVLLIIFEARPEVIANIASLAIKSGNAAILKGGKESNNSFAAISTVISQALQQTQVPNAAIQLVKTRDVIDELLNLDRYIDLVIPRGGNELVRYIKEHTRIPVLGHADGLCSIFIHRDADKDLAVKVIVDAKTDYPAACNTVETLLVHEHVLTTILPAVAEALLAKGVTLRCDAQSKLALQQTLPASSSAIIQDATEEDFNTEFLDLIIAVKTVPSPSPATSTPYDDNTHPPTNGTSTTTPTTNGTTTNGTTTHTHTPPPDPALDLAISHINTHSSSHTDAILTSSRTAAEYFMSAIDSAGVYWNASTRFADGMRYGFGTEVGISTNKIHSRGPVGLEGLTIYKYKIRGYGQVAGDYGVGGGKRRFLHERMEL